MLNIAGCSSVFRGGHAAMASPPLGKSENIFWQDRLLKMVFQTYIFCSKVPSKCRKCRFRDPNFKMGFQTYIFCLKVPSKCRKCCFKDPNFKKFHGPPDPLQLCRHYRLPLTKTLATPLAGCVISLLVQTVLSLHWTNLKVSYLTISLLDRQKG